MSELAEQRRRERARDCPHDVNDLLKKERQYIPNIGTAPRGLVWCDDCHAWIGFEFDGGGEHER